MDDRQSIDLAAMLCSRLCHDMLSPVGALSNGLELLADETDAKMRANVIELLEQSAKISTDKLKFFRLAFGAAGGFGEAVPVEEAEDVGTALAADGGFAFRGLPAGRYSLTVRVPGYRLSARNQSRRPSWPTSSSCRASGITPRTRPPPSSTASATIPISPTLPPP